MDDKKFYVTTPIYYVTARPHLGSLYSTLLADVAARWNKLLGKKTFFLTGTDEHGQKIAQAAEKAGLPPKKFVDSFIPAYKDTWQQYDIAYDYFIRTTDEQHVKAVQRWLKTLQEKGDIYKAAYHGWYCTPCETFVLEKEATHQEGEAGPLCPSCGRPTIEISEETYFFKLSAYQDRLLAFYEQNPDFIIPKERSNEVINFVRSGLKDLSISRTTVKWGIPFPEDDQHVTYVWADALNNYITAIGYGTPGKEQQFKQWWPADLQILGKDIVRFHAVYWPAFLMASGLDLPKHLLVHGWINVNKQKMSKSFGNVIDPVDLYNKYGADAVRYYLMRQIAITHDSEFSIEDLEQKISSDLADDLGNLLNRLSALAGKHNIYDIPAPNSWQKSALELRDNCLTMLEQFHTYMEGCLYHMALATAWKFINQTNAYFHGQEPWKMVKHDQQQFIEVLSATAHSLRTIAMVLWPVMPKSMEQLLESLGITFKPEHDVFDHLTVSTWHHHFIIKKIPTLFKKPEQPMTEESHKKSESSAQAPTAGSITINDFTAIELLVGTIEQCELVPNSEKLLMLQVNFGDRGMRQILSGVRQFFTPDDLKGKQGVFVFNLQPRKMAGLESQGMMLFAKNHEGVLKMATVAGAVPNGTRLT